MKRRMIQSRAFVPSVACTGLSISVEFSSPETTGHSQIIKKNVMIILAGNAETQGARLAIQSNCGVVDRLVPKVAFPNPNRWVPKPVVIALDSVAPNHSRRSMESPESYFAAQAD